MTLKFDALLEGQEDCIDCNVVNKFPLKLGVFNKTGSTRTSFSFWAILETTDSEGNITKTAISGCNGSISGKGEHYLNFGTIDYSCGTTLKLTSIYMAYTDASGNDNRKCGPNGEPVDPTTISPKCRTSADIEIRTPLSGLSVEKNASCFGADNGEIKVTFSGGTPPYEVNFNNGGYVIKTSPVTYTNLAGSVAGINYTWAVKDAKGCIQSGSEIIYQPDQLGLTLTPTNATCSGGPMSISSAVTGSPLTDLQIKLDTGTWNAVAASPVVFSSLSAGSHTVYLRRISDNNCTTSQPATVSQPDALGLIQIHTDATCDNSNKFISAAITGTPLSGLEINIDGRSFSPVLASPVVFNGLTAASHTVIIRRISDVNCLVSKSATVNDPINCIVDQGCTPGYWKNHLEDWGSTVSSTNFFDFFNIQATGKWVEDINSAMDLDANGSLTLLEAISAEIKTSKNNGWFAALARHAVAAYLNASNPNVGYQYGAQDILDWTKAVFEGPTPPYSNRNAANAAAQELHNKFRIANERVCPLGNSKAQETPLSVSTADNTETSVVVNSFSAYPVPFRESLNV